jgi:hypothetical protein
VALMDAAAHLFATYGHADQFAQKLRGGEEERMVRCGGAAVLELRRREHMKTQMRQWMSSSSGRHLVLHLPSTVIIHSLLPYLDFETLITLRPVCHTFQPLVEAAAVAWMNRTFPAALTIHNEQRHEEKVEHSAGNEVCSSIPSSSSFSPSQPSPAASPSYNVKDAMWVYHQLQWCRLLPRNEQVELTPCSPISLIVRCGEACWFYPLTVENYRRFGGQLNVSLVEVLELVLTLHGPNTSRVRQMQRHHRAELKQERRLQEERRIEDQRAREEATRQKEEAASQERKVTVDRALAVINVVAEWKEDGMRWEWGTVTFVYDAGPKGWKSTVTKKGLVLRSGGFAHAHTRIGHGVEVMTVQ